MTACRARFAALLPALLLASASACGSSDATAPEDARNQTASTMVTPTNATVSRGGSTSVTAVFSVTGGLTISTIQVSRPYAGISIRETSTKYARNTVTRVFTIGTDQTIPIGAHQVSFKPGVSGSTGSVPPQVNDAVFTLTVTP